MADDLATATTATPTARVEGARDLYPDRPPFVAVLFDLDGTLVDSTASVLRCWLRWAEEESVDPRRLEGWHGVPARTIVGALLAAERVPGGIERIDALEVSDTEGILALPGALEALSQLPAERVAVATSCTTPLARARMAAAGVGEPAVLVTADMVSRGKPDPEPFLLAAERLGVDPARCLVVEDAPAGLQAARAAGCASLGVVSTHTAEQLAGEADAVVPDLSHVRWHEGPDGVRVLEGEAR